MTSKHTDAETEFRNEVDAQYAAEAQAHHQAQYPDTDCGMIDFDTDTLVESSDSDLGSETYSESF